MFHPFLPLYCTLVAGGLLAGALAVRWTMKLRQGTLHLLGPHHAHPDEALQPRDAPSAPIPH